jgi:hypothetical protein
MEQGRRSVFGKFWEESGMKTVKPSLIRARMSRLLWRWEVCGTSAM